MPVMQIGIVGVLVRHRRMAMPMTMGLVGRVVRAVLVLVVRVVDVPVFVLQRLVRMFVLVRFRQVEVEADRH